MRMLGRENPKLRDQQAQNNIQVAVSFPHSGGCKSPGVGDLVNEVLLYREKWKLGVGGIRIRGIGS